MIKNILVLIIIVIIIYLSVFIYKLSKLCKTDIFVLKYLPKYLAHSSKQQDIQYPPDIIMKHIIQIFLIPFKENNYIYKFSEGTFYNSYIVINNKDTIHNFNDKSYWFNIFNKYNINHPKVIFIKKNNKIYKLNNYNRNKMYIIKPLHGTLGENVKKISGTDINNYIKKENNIIIQNQLVDCHSENVRHFRYISLYNGEKFILVEIISKKKNKVTSNGGKHILCNVKCNNLTTKQNTQLNNFINEINIMHKKEFPYVFSIGWDIMIDCTETGDKLYCLEGNLAHSIWFNEFYSDSIVNSYKSKLTKFLIKNKYLY